MTWTRRVMLKTIGVGAVGCATPACNGGGEEGNVPPGVGEMCGSDLCVSLRDNPDLAEIGALLLFTAQGRKIFVSRVSNTEFRALSAICTHAGCTIGWDGTAQFNCDCHGSQFSAAGAVLKGPAATPLREFDTTLAGDLLTIAL